MCVALSLLYNMHNIHHGKHIITAAPSHKYILNMDAFLYLATIAQFKRSTAQLFLISHHYCTCTAKNQAAPVSAFSYITI